MPNSVCNDSKQEIKSLFEERVENCPSQTEERVENCREAISTCEPPSPKVMRMIKKVFSQMEEESGEFTTEKVENCREANRSWLALGDRVRVLKDSMGLFDENNTPAKESTEISEFRKQLKEKLSIEQEMIKAQLSQRA